MTGFRRALAGLLLGALLALPGAPLRAAPVPKDVLVVGQIAEPASLDPAVSTATNDFRILVNLYEGLVRYRPGTLDVEPALAERWTVSDDGLTYRFALRPGVTFHDGTPCDAQAVKFNFDRMLDRTHPAADTGPFPLAFFFAAIDRVEAPDPLTVRITLKEPFAPFLSNLAYPTGLIVSPAAVMREGRGFGRRPVGTGPFRFVEWQGSRRLTIERNPDYWGTPAKLRAVIFRPVSDPNTRAMEMLAGGLDVMVEVPADALSQFRDGDGFRVHEQAGPHLWFLILNTRHGPLKDRRVRQAVNYAIDKRAIADSILQGTAIPAKGPTAPAFDWATDPAAAGYPYDPAKARALLKEAGAEGARLTFYVAEGGSGMLDPVAMGTAIQANLAAVGLDVTIETYEWNSFLARVNGGLGEAADMAEMAWMTNDPDTLPYLTLRSGALPEAGGFNSGYYANPELDRLLEQARRSGDRAERGALYRQAERIIVDDAPWAFVAHWKQNAVTTAAVRGFALEPSFFLLLDRVSKD
ncbi:ABC transporter substrate-binding protein [Azospirillum argentinense]|uniref:Solute-binding protein family 5 domain-containing protein n=1 Tax=Azospirillum argentinense TaxID=2970906 RepID=A0A5B0KN83_9PROT|nr:ABC transporter substrate-binding protein [Azospirillum argentinense]KAA1053273.1 ABC transporter, substrate-binding protein (cluster 5, nickel/peptides/opines) [Azospirillum argentinense]